MLLMYVDWTEDVRRTCYDKEGYTGSEIFIPVRCLDEVNVDTPFAPVRVQAVIEADAQLVHTGTKCVNGKMVYPHP